MASGFFVGCERKKRRFSGAKSSFFRDADREISRRQLHRRINQRFLSLKEAYLLTVEIRKTFQGTPFEPLSVDISSDVYSQLSSYARDSLQAHIRDAGLDYQEAAPGELIGMREEIHDVIYFLKSGEPCVLQLSDGRSFTGTLRTIKNGLVLESSDGSSVPLPEDTEDFFVSPAR